MFFVITNRIYTDIDKRFQHSPYKNIIHLVRTTNLYDKL